MTDPVKLDDTHLLAHFVGSTIASERSAYRAETIKRMSAQGLDPKICATLADGYASAVHVKNITESTGFERELLRRMRPPEPPMPPPAPIPPAPVRQAAVVARPVSGSARPLRPPEIPVGPPFNNASLHDFFLAVAEYHEQVAMDSTQFAILCRRMCEKIKPEAYKKDEG
jgi:hypothetical protein